MKSGMVIFSPPECEGISPELLAVAHPLLQEDVARYSPWTFFPTRKDACADTCVDIPETYFPCWRGASEDAPFLPEAAAVLVCGACTSSLDIAWQLQQQGGLPPWTTVLATEQRSGRGQLRRPWRSPLGNIHAALRLPEALLRAGDLAPLIAGYALLRGVESALGSDAAADSLRLKWPNDILMDGRKVGGVLLEERAGVLVAGIGLNVVAPPDIAGLEREPGAPPVGYFGEAGQALRKKGPLQIWESVVKGMYTVLESGMPYEAPDTIVELVESVLAWKGRHVLVHEKGVTNSSSGFDKPGGVVVGIAVDGALRLASSGKEIRLRSGSIVLAQL